jgi:acyl carrier protein
MKIGGLKMEEQVKKMIVDILGLDISPEEIDADASIFGTGDDGRGLGLDSVDMLELVVGINQVFGIKHQSDDLSILRNVRTLTEYIEQKIGR